MEPAFVEVIDLAEQGALRPLIESSQIDGSLYSDGSVYVEATALEAWRANNHDTADA